MDFALRHVIMPTDQLEFPAMKKQSYYIWSVLKYRVLQRMRNRRDFPHFYLQQPEIDVILAKGSSPTLKYPITPFQTL